MKKLTIEEVQAQQKAAEKLAKANGNRVEIWYNAETESFTLCELTGSDYMVSESPANFRIPRTLNYMGFEKKAEREADLERRTLAVIEEINAWKEEQA